MVLWMETKSFGAPPIWQKEQVGKKRIHDRSVASLREYPTRFPSKFVHRESLCREATTARTRSLKARPSPTELPGSHTNRGRVVLDETRARASSPLLDTLQITISSWKCHYFYTPPQRKKALSSSNKQNSGNYRHVRWALLPCSRWTPTMWSWTTGWEVGKLLF